MGLELMLFFVWWKVSSEMLLNQRDFNPKWVNDTANDNGN